MARMVVQPALSSFTTVPSLKVTLTLFIYFFQNGDDSDEDDEDYDEAEETALESYETLLDKEDCPIDEYDIFKTIVASTCHAWYPANMRHSPNAVSMLDQRQRRWPNIETTLVECLMFSLLGMLINYVYCIYTLVSVYNTLQ